MAISLRIYLSEPLCYHDLPSVENLTVNINNYLADHFHRVVVIGIDKPAIKQTFDN